MTVLFLKFWITALSYAGPILCLLLAILGLSGLLLGRIEKMSRADSLYLAFITALTVGYGDKTPKTGQGKVLCIAIGLLGMCFTGIFVGCSLFAAEQALKAVYLSAPM
ncbi:MAG: potassium channel family protein [Desulfovibrio sp.]